MELLVRLRMKWDFFLCNRYQFHCRVSYPYNTHAICEPRINCIIFPKRKWNIKLSVSWKMYLEAFQNECVHSVCLTGLTWVCTCIYTTALYIQTLYVYLCMVRADINIWERGNIVTGKINSSTLTFLVEAIWKRQLCIEWWHISGLH